MIHWECWRHLKKKKKPTPTNDPEACCLPEFQRLTCQEVRELHIPQNLYWVPSCIRSYFSAACKCRMVLSPHSNSVQWPGSLPSKKIAWPMCLPSSDMLVTLWLCQNCTLQTFGDTRLKWKQPMGYLLQLGVRWVSSSIWICSLKGSSD